MPANTIQYAHAESKILIIQPPDWNQPKGYSAEIRVLLGLGTESLPATARTIPGGRAFIHCEALFDSGPNGGIPLPLKIGDIVEFALEGVDVRVLAVKKGQSIVNPTASFTNMPINVLFAAHPTPPVQPAVGKEPIRFLTDAAFPSVNFIRTQFAGYALNGPLSRADVWAICTNPAIDPLAAYAVAMAWGEQTFKNFRTSVVAAGLPGLLTTLRTTKNSREHDFSVVAAAAANIKGLKIAFYTKLLYFFRPNPDAYILDQWTAKSSCILFNLCPIRLGSRGENGYFSPHPATTPSEYEAFCLAVEGLVKVLWLGRPATGAQAEAAMFDEGRRRGMWRVFIKDHFVHREVGDALKAGARCLTTAQDFDDGLLIIEESGRVHVYLRPGIRIAASTVWGTASLLDFLRILLAKIRQLGAVTLHLPTGAGGVLLPDWFHDACAMLGVKIIGVSGEYGDGNDDDDGDDDDDQEDEQESQQPPNNPIIQPLPKMPPPQQPPNPPIVGGHAEEMPPQPLRKLISEKHITAGLYRVLRHEGNPARITVTARPNEGNAYIRWQYHLQTEAVRIDLFFSSVRIIYTQVEKELKANLGPTPTGLKFHAGGSFNITLTRNVLINPRDPNATAVACVKAMEDFQKLLRTNSATASSWWP